MNTQRDAKIATFYFCNNFLKPRSSAVQIAYFNEFATKQQNNCPALLRLLYITMFNATYVNLRRKIKPFNPLKGRDVNWLHFAI